VAVAFTGMRTFDIRILAPILLYSRQGEHLGAIDPTTGQYINPSVQGRTIRSEL